MRGFLVSLSYVFHPLLVPFAGAVAFFMVNPTSTYGDYRLISLVPIFILTIIVPIILFFILRRLRMVESIFIPALRSRSYPLLVSVLLLLVVLFFIIPKFLIPELHYFFLGLCMALLTTWLLVFIKFKSSIHMMGMGSMWVFVIGLSIHFEKNVTLALSALTFLTGLVASSRLLMKSHTHTELFIGFLIGSLSQLLLFQFWL